MKQSSSGPTKDDGSCAELTLLPTRAMFDCTGRTHQCQRSDEMGLLMGFADAAVLRGHYNANS